MIVDAAVHPVLGDKELGRRVGEPWASGRLPHHLGARYAPAFDEVIALPAEMADPDNVARLLLDDCGVDLAIITPLGRGIIPNPQAAAAVARSLNEWVAQEWLDAPTARGRFAGSIRLSITNVSDSLAEIERWGPDPRFVQVAVPLRAFSPYGDDAYFPIWQAAAEQNMPVCIYDDGATVIEHPETPFGPLRFFAERHALKPMTSMVHIASLITSGVFDRLPGLKFVFGDGGVDMARSMLWRIDKDWKSARVEIPWIERLPSLYADGHLRFIAHPEDGLADGVTVDEDLVRISDSRNLLLFGSHYPFWRFTDPRTALAGWTDDVRTRVMGLNVIDTVPRLGSFVDAVKGAPTSN